MEVYEEECIETDYRVSLYALEFKERECCISLVNCEQHSLVLFEYELNLIRHT